MLYAASEASYLKLLSCNFSTLVNGVGAVDLYGALRVVQVLHNVHTITGFNIFKPVMQEQVISVVRENLKQ